MANTWFGARSARLAALGLALAGVRASAQLFVADTNAYIIGEYSGAGYNPFFIPQGSVPPFVLNLAVTPTHLYAACSSANVIAEYDLSGAVVNASFASAGLQWPFGIAVANNRLYVSNLGPTGGSSADHVGFINVYDATTGALLAANFVTGLDSPYSIAVAGNVLYVANANSATVATYDATTGATLNPAFIASDLPCAVAVANGLLYVSQASGQGFDSEVSTYDPVTGAPVNIHLVPDLPGSAFGLAVAGDRLYVTTQSSPAAVSVYDAGTGALIDASFIPGLTGPYGLAVIGPSLTTQPAAVTAPYESTATFSAAATGTGPIAYQWYANGQALSDGAGISGSQSSTLVLSAVKAAQAGSYTVVVSDDIGSATSEPAALSILGTATFATPLSPLTVSSGSAVYLSAPASGTGTVSYQWELNGVPIPGATGAALLLTGVTAAGQYTLVASDETGESETTAQVSLAPAESARLMNISVRGDSQPGADQLIAGFTVAPGSGAATKPVLLRAVGPELAQFGVAGALPDPLLQLYSTSAAATLLAHEAGWESVIAAADLQAIETATGAFPLAADSLSSALLTSLDAGSYSINVTGNSGDSGVALAEIYDASTGFDAATPTLINLSGRGYVAGGLANLYGGFVIGGTADVTVLIRGVGPALGGFGISQPLSACALSVHTTAQGADTVLASNSGWNGDPQIEQAGNAVGAFALPPGSLDSAVLLTLPPGDYTAELSSANGQPGVGLIEVYQLP